MRTKKQILKAFDEGYPKFKGLIEKYYPKVIPKIEKARKNEHISDLLIWLG